MKKKSNILIILILVFLIFLCVFTYCVCNKEYTTRLKIYEEKLNYIETNSGVDIDDIDLIYPVKSSATELYGRVVDKIFILQWIFPMAIIIFSSYDFYKVLHSGFIKNISFRQLYSKYIRNSVLKSWLKSIIVFVVPHIIIFMICAFYSDFKLFDGNSSYISSIFNNNIPLLLSYFLYLMFYALFCCNLGLIFNKKNRRYIVNIILSEIVYIALTIFLELGIGTIIDNLSTQNRSFIPYSSSATFLSVFNIFPYYYINILSQHWVTMLIIIILFTITTCLVYLIYSDKESVIIESEN